MLARRSLGEGGSYTPIYGNFKETLIILPNFLSFDNRDQMYYYKYSLKFGLAKFAARNQNLKL